MKEQARKTGKQTFYCVMAEFYANGSVKTGISSRFCKEKPGNTIGKNPIMTAYTDWFETREQAEAFLAARTLKPIAA